MNAWLAVIYFVGEKAAGSHRYLIPGHMGLRWHPSRVNLSPGQIPWVAKVKKDKLQTRGKKPFAFPLQMCSLKKYPASFLSQCRPVRKRLGVGHGEDGGQGGALCGRQLGLSRTPTPAAPPSRAKLVPLCFSFFFRVLLPHGGGHFLLAERLLIIRRTGIFLKHTEITDIITETG